MPLQGSNWNIKFVPKIAVVAEISHGSWNFLSTSRTALWHQELSQHITMSLSAD